MMTNSIVCFPCLLPCVDAVNICRIVPGGILVFFPSYSFMDACIETWQVRRLTGAQLGDHQALTTSLKLIHHLPIYDLYF